MTKILKHEESAELFSCLLMSAKAIIRHVWGTGEHFDLTGPQFGVLMRLKRYGPMTPTELSESLLVSAGNITGMIARLQKQGLVERRRLTSDRRSLRIALTSNGNERLEQIIPWWKKQVNGCFRGLSLLECRELARLLQKICRFLNPDELFPGSEGDKA